jgi:4-diphosphocytidyl-2-C-methyl-D-erythritol kinase
VVLNSYAKLNLYLKVLSKRKDNYHNLETIFERIDLCDKIILKPVTCGKIRITSDSRFIPKGEANLVFRAASLLKHKFKVKSAVDIKIIKRIPVSAGMGGGSSNAACVLCALNKLWNLHLGKRKLLALGRKLGADVPFFIYDTSFARGSDRGDRISPLGQLRKIRFWHVLAVPRIQVSTASVYQKWDKISRKATLTSLDSDVKMLTSALKRKNLSLISKSLFNSLEEAAVLLYPEIKKVKERLSRLGLQAVLMSGSGPTLFATVDSRKEALSLARQLSQNRSLRIYITRTI